MKKSKAMTTMYIVLYVTVLAIMVRQMMMGNWNNVMLCALTLVLFLIPSFAERRINIAVPDALEIVILLFIFAAEILGEIREYYVTFRYWDTMLHTVNGFLMAAIGFSLVDILNRNKKISIELSPVFVALVAFCFSMTIGVAWEFFEYGMDSIFNTDMQKDTCIEQISSVALGSGNNVITVDVEKVEINGENWTDYLDIGLVDTMNDLFVNFIGAFVYSIMGYLYIKNRKKGRIIPKFLIEFKD